MACLCLMNQGMLGTAVWSMEVRRVHEQHCTQDATVNLHVGEIRLGLQGAW